MINELFLWLNNNSSILLMFATFALAIVAYLQVRASYKQISESRLIRNIDKHTEQLRTLIELWHHNLPLPPKTGIEVYDLSVGARFEENKLFPDIANHLPPEHKDLMKKWENYKDLLQKYHQTQTEILNKINKLQKEKVDTNFSKSIYLNTIELLTDKKYYDHRIQLYRVETSEYNFHYEKKGDGIVYVSSPNLKEEIDKIKNQFDEISDIVKKECKKDIENLLNIEGKLDENFKELADRLNDLTKYTEYYNMNCKYIPKL